MKKSYSTLIFFGSLILFIGVVIAGISMFRGMSQKQGEPVKTLKSQVVVPTAGVEENTAPLFSFDAPPSDATAGQAFEIPVLLNSIGKDVTGFDVIVTYDHTVLTLNSVTAAEEGFDVFEKKVDGRVTITGIKQLGNNASAVFANIPVVLMQFTPRAMTETTLRIQPTVLKDKTKIVDGASMVTGQDTVREIMVQVQ